MTLLSVPQQSNAVPRIPYCTDVYQIVEQEVCCLFGTLHSVVSTADITTMCTNGCEHSCANLCKQKARVSWREAQNINHTAMDSVLANRDVAHSFYILITIMQIIFF